MKISLLVIIVAIVGLFLLHSNLAFAANTLNIHGIIKKGTIFGNLLYVQNEQMKFTFGNTNPLCPNNNCNYKFEDGDFSDSLLGGDNDKVFSGVLKIEDKKNSGGNFTSYINYKMSVYCT